MGFYTKVVGVTFENRQKFVLETRINDILSLERDRYNEYDRNAIKVVNMQGNQIGFLSKEVSRTLAPLIDSGSEYIATVTGITGTNLTDHNLGVNVYIENKGTSNLYICKKCGEQMPFNANYCSHCGYSKNTSVINSPTTNEETSKEYEEGCYKIGVDMPEGEYQLFCTDDNYQSYYKISPDANGNETISSEIFKRNSYIEVKENQFLRLKNCKAISTNTQNNTINTLSSLEVISPVVNNEEMNKKRFNSDDFIIDGTTLIKYNGQDDEVIIPQGVTKINESAFEENQHIQNVIIMEGVTEIGAYAFNMCKNLKNISIPNTVSAIGEFAFSECERLSNITIPPMVTKIQTSTFSLCTRLENIKMNNINEICDYAFAECRCLSEIILPTSISKVARHAFKDCWNLVKVNLPNKDIDIASDAFDGCDTDIFYEVLGGNKLLDIMTSQELGTHRGGNLYSERDMSDFDSYIINH